MDIYNIIMKLKRLKKTVLFICKHNSARSQMAEGLLKDLYGDHYDVYSAGTQSDGVNPYAIKVMADRGIDISGNLSKNLNKFKGQEFDYVVTVCDDNSCPIFPGGNIYLHKSFQDPSSIDGDEESKIRAFINIRDEIEEFLIEKFLIV